MLSVKQLKQQTCRYCHTPYLTLKNGFIDNGDVKNKNIPKYLDYDWYIRLAKSRIKDFEGE